MTAFTGSPPAGFWARVERRHSGCWEFCGGRDELGYGRLHWNGRKQRAHRIAYELTMGSIPADLIVMHTCDNPPCCNPEHLRLGTVAENNSDRHLKGRTIMPHSVAPASRPHGTRPRYRSGCRCEMCHSVELERRKPIDAAYRERRRAGQEKQR